jgi:fusaric acid resistance family protein
MGTEAITAPAAQPRRRRTVPGWDWLRRHDPGYAALRRAARTALIMPTMFAIGDKVIGNPILATFAAFGSFAMLLLVDFSGPIRDRVLAQSALVVACAVLICLGTLASRWAVVAALAMAVVGFAILFAGVVSSVLAGATTSLLLAFILPVSLPGPVSSIPDRVAGWGLSGVVSILAIAVLWPSPARNPVRVAAIDACRALAQRLRAEIAWVSGHEPGSEEAYRAAVTHAEETVDGLHRIFFATPYRPTGLTTAARAVVRLVDELRWLNTIVLHSKPPGRPGAPNQAACAVRGAAAEVLAQTADLLERPGRDGAELHAALEQMRGALASLEMATTSRLPELAASPDGEAGVEGGDGRNGNEGRRARAVVSALDPSFRAQELSWVVSQIALNTDFAAAAERRSWIDRLLGRQPEGLRGPVAAATERAGAHVERNSLWLHNSLRGAAGLALAVLIADLSGVQHAFWVVFGTLSVLRSNALSTGQNVVRALLGTTAGFIVGGALVALIGTNTTVLWVLLPIAVLIAGLAPATVSFAAGQAAFTLTLLILFNILAPAGWKIGLLRIEDIAIGTAVSLVVGVLFWPRGAAAALGKALSEAYADSARYLAGAVAYGLGRCDDCVPTSPPPREEAVAAAAAARRLDDTFRGYLTERGAKPIPLSEVTGLVTGVAGVRLAADAVLELWDGDGSAGGDRSAARQELQSSAGLMTGWYEHFAASLAGAEPVPEPLPADEVADGRLVDAVARDLRDSDGHATAAGVRVIWTGDHLDAVRRLQEMLVEPARAAVSEQALG